MTNREIGIADYLCCSCNERVPGKSEYGHAVYCAKRMDDTDESCPIIKAALDKYRDKAECDYDCENCVLVFREGGDDFYEYCVKTGVPF